MFFRYKSLFKELQFVRRRVCKIWSCLIKLSITLKNKISYIAAPSKYVLNSKGYNKPERAYKLSLSHIYPHLLRRYIEHIDDKSYSFYTAQEIFL